VVEWLTLLLHIREVLGSNFCLDTGYPEFFITSPSLQANVEIVPKNSATTASFPIDHSHITLSFDAI
jgi:hypothetical protein